jgi:hypothetical protein
LWSASRHASSLPLVSARTQSTYVVKHAAAAAPASPSAAVCALNADSVDEPDDDT